MKYVARTHSDKTVKLPGWRATVLFAVMLCGLAVLLVRGLYLQGIHNDFLQEKGEARYSRLIEVSAHRGKISDRNGEPLALSTPVESVWASPAEVKANPLQIKKLSKVLGMSEKVLKARLSDNGRDFVYLKRRLPPDQIEKIVNLNIPGVMLQREYRRYYPAGEEVAQTLGFTGQDDNGLEGLELVLQERLAGKPGSQRVIKDRRGRIVEEVGSLHASRPGSDVVVSLDSNLQHMAYRELKNSVKQHQAKSGSIVVLDAVSGEVLALANYPGFNPNSKRNEPDIKVMRNRAITDLFEPGSTMKPFTVATAIEAGQVTSSTLINTENGVFTVSNRKIHDQHPSAIMSVAQVIQRSSNVGSAKVALMMKSETLWQGLTESGFGAQTGSNFPGEAAGKLRDPKTWRPIEQATISYGHGVSVSLLQLARAYTVFASDGELKPVSLLKQEGAVTGVKVFSSNTVRSMRNMLESVTQPGGTAPLAQVPGYRVAGKTGTSHKLEGGRYVKRYVASFVGFAPVSNPRLVVAVMIDEPSGEEYYGGLVAAPVFSKVTGEALRALNVPNDASLDNVIVAPSNFIKEEV